MSQTQQRVCKINLKILPFVTEQINFCTKLNHLWCYISVLYSTHGTLYMYIMKKIQSYLTDPVTIDKRVMLKTIFQV